MARRYRRKKNGQFAGGIGGGGSSAGSGTKAKMGTTPNKAMTSFSKQQKARRKTARRRLAAQIGGGIVGANVGAAATLGNPIGIAAGAYGGAYGAGKVYDKRSAKAKANKGKKLKPGIKS